MAVDKIEILTLQLANMTRSVDGWRGSGEGGGEDKQLVTWCVLVLSDVAGLQSLQKRGIDCASDSRLFFIQIDMPIKWRPGLLLRGWRQHWIIYLAGWLPWFLFIYIYFYRGGFSSWRRAADVITPSLSWKWLPNTLLHTQKKKKKRAKENFILRVRKERQKKKNKKERILNRITFAFPLIMNGFNQFPASLIIHINEYLFFSPRCKKKSRTGWKNIISVTFLCH